MQNVRFTCDGKNRRMFLLQSLREMDYVPVVGDFIDVGNEDFQFATFRVKPWYNDKELKSLKNYVQLNFKVVKRTFDLRSDTWEVICEPTTKSLLFLLQNLKVRKKS